MKKTLIVIATVMGVISFLPSIVTVFGPEMGFGVSNASPLVYLVYLIPIAWVAGLICYIFSLKSNEKWPLLLTLTLILWTIPVYLVKVISSVW